MVTSEIRLINGDPALFVNGERVLEDAYITYFIKKARYSDFAEKGYRLFSVPLYFAGRGITEYNEIPAFDDGVFDNKDCPDYSVIDRAFLQIIEACPDAYIFPRVNMSLPLWWEQENPDELCDIGFLDMNKKRPCFASDKWLADTKDMLGKFIDHIEGSSYRDHVIGYQIAGGNTEEWFGFDMNGSSGKRSKEKFEIYKKEKGISGTEAEYYSFLSEIVSDLICNIADFAKEKTGHRLVMGTFYGYTFECQSRESNHHAFAKMLKSSSIDFVCSPISYMMLREAGRDHPCMLPLESAKLHKKLYFMENDARTHLSGPLFDVPHFDNPHYKPRSILHSTETLKMYFSRALIKSHAFWWFDMGGGWYDYPKYMEMMGDFIDISREALSKDRRSVSEVAVVVDERSLPRFDKEGKISTSGPVVYDIRYALGLMGAPYDSYLADDYDWVKKNYKSIILLEPIETELSVKIKSDFKNCLVINAENKDITTSELRDFLKSTGVHIYSNDDAVIYVNKSYLFIHTANDGRLNIRLPEGKMLKQRYGDPVDIDNQILPQRTSYLFEVVDVK